MRIAMVHWAFPPVIGGVESHLATLCPVLRAGGAEVDVLTGSVDGRHERGVWSGVRLTRTPLMDLNALRGLDVARVEADVRREVEQFLEAARPGVVHAHNMHYFTTAHLDALAAWCRRVGVPLVLTAHNVWDDDIWRRTCARADVWERVIAVSGYISRELTRSGFPLARQTVVHHGIDTTHFRPRGAAYRQAVRDRYPWMAGRRVVFHPARTSLAKGSFVAVEALEAIRRRVPDALLVCAGAGPIVDWNNVQEAELGELRERVRGLGLQDHVLIRAFAWEEMVDLFQAADVTVYPSVAQEPFGLGVLEAMACGSPVVVSRSGGMPEFVEDGRTGFVVPRSDAAALAQRCTELLMEPGCAATLRRAARRSVLERHTVGRMAERTLRVYESVGKGGRVA